MLRLIRPYFPRTTLQDYKPKSHHSWIWRNLANPSHNLLRESRWKIGDGHNIPLTHPNWFRCSNHNLIRNNLLGGSIADLINQDTRTWNQTILKKLYHPNICNEIMHIPIPKSSRLEDKLLWKHSTSGEYRVNKAYSLIQQDGLSAMGHHRDLPHWVWKLLWKIDLSHKIFSFIWKILRRSLPMFEILNKRGIRNTNLCTLCNEEEESIDHLFLHCPFARAVWHGSNLEVRTSELVHSSVDYWFSASIMHNINKGQDRMFFLQSLCTILWMIWNHRHKVLHQGKLPNPMEVILTT